jgi:hypothetical protein
MNRRKRIVLIISILLIGSVSFYLCFESFHIMTQGILLIDNTFIFIILLCGIIGVSTTPTLIYEVNLIRKIKNPDSNNIDEELIEPNTKQELSKTMKISKGISYVFGGSLITISTTLIVKIFEKTESDIGGWLLGTIILLIVLVVGIIILTDNIKLIKTHHYTS